MNGNYSIHYLSNFCTIKIVIITLFSIINSTSIYQNLDMAQINENIVNIDKLHTQIRQCSTVHILSI